MKRSARIISNLLGAILLVTSMMGALPASIVHAAPLTYTVNLLTDAGDGTCDTTCTLRDAILAANANSNAGSDMDTIKFGLSGTITPATPLPNINGNLVIDGTGYKVSINGNSTKRIFWIQTGIVTINNLTIQNGFTTLSGGGIYNNGGGTLTVANSTFTGNKAPTGGAIANYGITTIVNSTFYNNQATQNGGGAFNVGGTLTILNSTFHGNSAVSNGGGVFNEQSSTLNLGNTILAGSTGGDCANNGTIGSNTGNLIQDNSCSALINGDPKLMPLADNDGYTQTMALLPDSPARNQGDATICSTAPVSGLDQRGMPRDTPCDIGAYEAVGSSTLDIYPNPLNFGEVTIGTTSLAKEVKVTYLGEETIHLGQLTIAGEFAFSGYNNCNFASLGPGSFCTFSVEFSPTTIGAKTGTVIIPDNSAVTLGILNLKGTGTDPKVGLSVTSLNFPLTFVNTTSPSRLVTITNTGTGTLILGDFFTNGDFILHSNKCKGAKLPDLGKCTFKISFSPQSPGIHNGWVRIKSNAASSEVYPGDRVTLTGKTKAGEQLLKMGNFDVVPIPPETFPWKVSSPESKLVRLWDCTTFRSPFCSARFTGSSTYPILSAFQVVKSSGQAGDKFFISLSSRAHNVPIAGQYKLVVSFYKVYGWVGSVTLLFGSGTHAYQTVSTTYAAPAGYDRIVFNFSFQKSTGTAWFDDAMLIRLP